MRSETPNFRVVNLAFDHTNLPMREDPMGNRLYIPPVRGVIYIIRLTIRSLFSPNPRVLTALPGASCLDSTSTPTASSGTRAVGGCAQVGSRGAFSTTHNEFLASTGLVYISTRWLVYLSSGLLGFRAALAAVVPSVPRRRLGAISTGGVGGLT